MKLLVLLLGLVILINLVALIIYLSSTDYVSGIYDKEVLGNSEIDVFFVVGENPGFAVEEEYLHFGKLTHEGNSYKNITLYPLDIPILVHIDYSENLINHISVSDNDFILYPKSEGVEVKFGMGHVQGLEYGNYTGKVYLYYLKP
jgi:hypothetical protein